MHLAIVIVKLYIFFLSLFKLVQWLFLRKRWTGSKRSQCSAARSFRECGTPFQQLSTAETEVISTLIQLEAMDSIGRKHPFNPKELSPDVYRIVNPAIEKKPWLQSNTDITVQNTLNGFEALIPSPGRRYLQRNEISEIHFVFYGDIAVAIRAPGHFDIFEQQKAKPLFARHLSITKTQISSTYTSSGALESPKVQPSNSDRLIRHMDNTRAIMFKDSCLANGYILIIGTAGVLSLIIALIYIGVVSDVGPAYLAEASPGLTLAIAISLIWPLLVAGFIAVDHIQFNRQPVIVFNREQRLVYLSPSTGEKTIVIPWHKLNISIRHLDLRGVGLEYPVNFAQLKFTSTTPDSSVVLGTQSLAAGIGIWQTLHSYMLKELHCIRGLDKNMAEYRPEDPPRDDVYLFTRRFRQKIDEKDFFALIGWLILAALTLGPLPYILASVCSRCRARQAKRRI